MTQKKKTKLNLLDFFRRKFRFWMAAATITVFLSLTTLSAAGSNPAMGANYRFIQLKNGETIEAQAMPGSYRSEAVVSRFAGDVVTLGYRWDSSKRYVEDRKILFPASHAAVSWLFVPDARLKWAVDYAQRYGQRVGSNKAMENSYAMLTSDPVVEQQKNGLWFVDVRAIRFVLDSKDVIVNQEKLHFKFALKAKNPDKESFWTLADEGLEPYMDRFWADGLQIVDVVRM